MAEWISIESHRRMPVPPLLRTSIRQQFLTAAGLFCYRGASGFVQLALDKRTNEQVAIKFLERGGGASQRVIARELLNHRECALHPNIVQLKVHRLHKLQFSSVHAWPDPEFGHGECCTHAHVPRSLVSRCLRLVRFTCRRRCSSQRTTWASRWSMPTAATCQSTSTTMRSKGWGLDVSQQL
jgi:hypothetical protein